MISAFGIDHGEISKAKAPKLPKKLKLKVSQSRGMTHIDAVRRKTNVGGLRIVNEPGAADHGEIWGVEVAQHYRRKGIATAMYKEAKRRNIPIKHSSVRTDAGDAWAKKVGGEVPPKWDFKL